MTDECIMLLNLEGPDNGVPLYECEYKFSRTGYKIEIFEEGVCIRRFSAKNVWTFEPVSKQTNDSIRKAYIIYALWMGRCFEITSIKVICCGEEVANLDRNKSATFPFVFSMLGQTRLTRQDDITGENGVFKNTAILKQFAESNRSKDYEDRRIAVLFAFLQGRSREYEADRFLNYWTAINAMYGYLISERDQRIEGFIDTITDEEYIKNKITKEHLRRLFIPVNISQDGEQIKVFSKLLRKIMKIKNSGGSKGISLHDSLKKVNSQYVNNYQHFATVGIDDEGCFRFTYEKLYDLVMSNKPSSELTFENEDAKAAYLRLEEAAEEVGVSLFAFLSLQEPYYKRNYFIHGSEAQMVISDTYNLHLLSCLNYFMDKLIKEYLPQLFDESKLNDLINIIHTVIYNQNSNKTSNNAKDKKPDEEYTVYDNKDTAKAAKEIAKSMKLGNKSWLEGGKMY